MILDLTTEECAHVLASLYGAKRTCRDAVRVHGEQAARDAQTIERLIAKIKHQTGIAAPANKVPA